MTELSPSAKIILAASAKANCFQEWDHVNDPPCHPGDSDWNGCYTCVHRAGIAAALRAAADQVVPEEQGPPRRGMRPGGTGALSPDEGAEDQRVVTRRKLLAIAEELETQ